MDDQAIQDLGRHASDQCQDVLMRVLSIVDRDEDKAKILLKVLASVAGMAGGALSNACGADLSTYVRGSPDDRSRFLQKFVGMALDCTRIAVSANAPISDDVLLGKIAAAKKEQQKAF